MKKGKTADPLKAQDMIIIREIRAFHGSKCRGCAPFRSKERKEGEKRAESGPASTNGIISTSELNFTWPSACRLTSMNQAPLCQQPGQLGAYHLYHNPNTATKHFVHQWAVNITFFLRIKRFGSSQYFDPMNATFSLPSPNLKQERKLWRFEKQSRPFYIHPDARVCLRISSIKLLLRTSDHHCHSKKVEENYTTGRRCLFLYRRTPELLSPKLEAFERGGGRLSFHRNPHHAGDVSEERGREKQVLRSSMFQKFKKRGVGSVLTVCTLGQEWTVSRSGQSRSGRHLFSF